jgi:hypothetical protein
VGWYLATREVKKITVCTILALSPQEMLWKTQIETWDSEARKKHFSVLAQTQRIRFQRLNLESKGFSLYIHLQAGCRGSKFKKKKQF